jgi:tetratricopeptide (TPR) repeat protein
MLIWILIVLAALSVFLAYSGYLPGHTSIGWALLAVYFVVYCAFVFRWLPGLEIKGFGDAPRAVATMLFCGFLLGIQGPLVLELVSHLVLPDPSRGLKLIKVYSEAETKVVKDDLPGAILEYEKVIAEDPDDIVARFRLAELCCQNEEYRKAAMGYEAILARKKLLSTSQHCSALTRLSEIYAEHLNDTATARTFVQTIVDQYPGTKYAGYAIERLKNIPG